MEREERGEREEREERERVTHVGTGGVLVLVSCDICKLYHIFTKSWGIPLILQIPTHTKGQATAAC
jgi:hypothetical protein